MEKINSDEVAFSGAEFLIGNIQKNFLTIFQTSAVFPVSTFLNVLHKICTEGEKGQGSFAEGTYFHTTV